MHSLLYCLILWATSPAEAADTSLIPPGSTWRVLDNGIDPGATWGQPGFNDGAWLLGDAQLGYGDGDETTLVSFGPDAADKHPTTWFRHTFAVTSADAHLGLQLHLLRDDGAVVYLNGVELLRDNLPAGPIDSATLAVTRVTGADESVFHVFELDSDELVTGGNTLAVEVHQAVLDSSDLSFDLELLAHEAVLAVSRGPYLNVNTEQSVIVKWRTNLPTDSSLEVGTAQGSLSVASADSTLTTEHELTVTGLSADTLYHYAVGSSSERLAGDDGSHTFRTSPMPGTSRPARFWFVGDSGTADANARAVRDAFWSFTGAQDPDLFVMLGDNAYNSGTDAEYQVAVFDTYPDTLRRVPVWSTLGNHDGYTADSATLTGPYYDIFHFPRAGEAGGVPSGTEAYYSFDYGNVHFICLDSYESDRSVAGPMLTWLEADLLTTDLDWIIAFWHHPPYSKGSHNSDTEGRLIEMRANALPMLEAYGVDLVLAGHSHSYERSFLIDQHYGLSDSFDPAVHGLDLGDGNEAGDGLYTKPTEGLAAHEGAVYITAGSSGKTSGGTFDHEAMQISLRELGSVVVDVDGLRLDARFLDETGAELDRFTIRKGCPAGSPDRDDDGLADACDRCPDDPLNDIDSDGVCGDIDLCPFTYDPDQQDTDGDGIGTLCDVCEDIDEDSICAIADNCPIDANPGQENSDSDSLGDVCDPCPNDGFNDADQDGLCGDEDNCPFTPNLNQADLDRDGIGDACDLCPDVDADGICLIDDNCPDEPNDLQEDADVDGIGDICDPCMLDPYDDIDDDGLCENVDNCPFAANPGQEDTDGDGTGDACDLCPDLDGDTHCDFDDNCPLIPNPDQADGDGNGTGDACEVGCDDADGDGACDDGDNCPSTINVDQQDTDGDGSGDACDICALDADDDADDDGFCADLDNCSAIANPTQEDADADGSGDACDPCPLDADDDADQDQVCADVDNCPALANADQADTDLDGLGDVCDPCPTDETNDADGDGECGPPATPEPPDTTVPTGGCGCDSRGAGASLALLPLLLAFRRRR